MLPVLIGLVMLAAAYGGLLLGTWVHEVLGHGLAAMMLGGRFLGYRLEATGLGYAHTWLPPDTGLGGQVWHLASGMVVTASIGTVLFLLAAATAWNPWLRLVLLALGVLFLADGLEYACLNAIWPRPPGDFGRIYGLLAHHDLPAEAVRWSVLVTTALAMTAVLVVTVLTLERLVPQLWAGLPDGLAGAYLIVALYVILPTLALGYLVPWGQLIHGVGYLPNHLMVASIIVTGLAVPWVERMVIQRSN